MHADLDEALCIYDKAATIIIIEKLRFWHAAKIKLQQKRRRLAHYIFVPHRFRVLEKEVAATGEAKRPDVHIKAALGKLQQFTCVDNDAIPHVLVRREDTTFTITLPLTFKYAIYIHSDLSSATSVKRGRLMS